MYIAGIDASMTSTAVVLFEVDGAGTVISKDYCAFSTTKKQETKRIHHYRPDDFPNNMLRYKWMLSKILPFVPEGSVIGIEDYAMAAKGKVFHIGEFGGILKYELLRERGVAILPIPPTTIKKYSCGNGSADKVMMGNAYEALSEKFDLSHLSQYKNPYSDIVDAFFIAGLMLDRQFPTKKYLDFIGNKSNEKSHHSLTQPLLSL